MKTLELMQFVERSLAELTGFIKIGFDLVGPLVKHRAKHGTSLLPDKRDECHKANGNPD
jgi:hypothetical protein